MITYKSHNRRTEDAYKYAIQVIVSHRKIKSQIYITNQKEIDINLVNNIIKHTLFLNSKYETLYLITLTNNIELEGERDQFIKIDFRSITEDDYLNKFFLYGARTERENDILREAEPSDDLILHFEEEYKPYEDLFFDEFQITLQDYCE